MKLVRTIFIAAAVLLPVSWTVAKANEPAPAAEGAEKKDKKSKTEKTEKTEKTTTEKKM